MKQSILTIFIGLLMLAPGCATTGQGMPELAPPIAKVVPHELEMHGDVRQDEYYWLNQREDQEVLDYLNAENGYLEARMKHTEEFQDSLFDEIVGRIKKDDSSVPYFLDGYHYYSRFDEGGEYRIYCRKEGSLDADEQVMLDANKLAEGHDYFSVRGNDVSSGNDILAYATDTVGRRIYTIQFKNLATGEILSDSIPEVTGNMTWAEDTRTLFYAKQDPETLRSYQIWRHALGTPTADDVLVYQEDDDTFGAYVRKSKSKRYIMIVSSQTLRSEYRFIDARKPDSEFKIVLPREDDHEYSVDHYGDHFYIRTNWKAKNFRLMKTPVGQTDKRHWEEVIGHRDDVMILGTNLFNDFLVVDERKDGLTRIRVMPWSGEGEHYIEFGEPAYAAGSGTNPQFDTKTLRYNYQSMTTPSSVYDYDMTERSKELMKQEEVLGDFDPANYVTERLMATARDGKQVPVSLCYRKGMRKEGGNPTLLYGYGSYGASIPASFRSSRLSLLDRGFVFALAHIRGSQTLGRAWYEDGKLFNKMNTFTDFVDAGEYLVAEGYADSEMLFAQGGSAGGLLMGAVVNLRPDLWKGVVANVPFVDVVTTMLDDSIPLTTGEYDEWGNPNEKDYYEYMLSYSPYDNVEAKAYPNMLVTTGLHDSQVQYFEPAKWVARLRAMKTDNNSLLMHINMDAGHGGASGRFKRYRETAREFAFMMDLAGIAQ